MQISRKAIQVFMMTLTVIFLMGAFANAQQQPPEEEVPGDGMGGEIDQPPMEDDATWGEDSVKAVECHSLYRSHIRNDRLERALDNWRCNYVLAPKSTLHIYVDGVRIMRHMISEAETEEEKEAYIDTLMQLYDDRIEHFGREGFVLGRKGVDLLRHDRSKIPESFEIIDKSIDLRGRESEYSVFHPYIITLTRLHDAGMVEDSKYVERFSEVVDIIHFNLREDEDRTEHWLRTRNRVKQSSMNYVNCEQFEQIFDPVIAECPEDEKLLSFTIDFMDDKGCTDQEFYVNTAEKLYEFRPTAEIAGLLANEYQNQENYDKAVEFYNDAIEMSDDEHEKGRYYLSLANISLSQDDFVEAKNHALNARKNRPDWGVPLLFLGNLYVQGATTCVDEGIEERMVYVLAVDKYEEARALDEDVEEQANKLIETYSEQFPRTEDIFFHGLQEGEEFELGCWINETTLVRSLESQN